MSDLAGRPVGRAVRRTPTRAEQRAADVLSRMGESGSDLSVAGEGVAEVRGYGEGKLTVVTGPWGSGKTYVLVRGFLLPVLRAGGEVAVNFGLEPFGAYAKSCARGRISTLEHPWQMAELRNTCVGIDEIIQWWPSSDGRILGTLERFILAEARHFGLSFVVTSQHLDKVNSGVKDRVHEVFECRGRSLVTGAVRTVWYPHGWAKRGSRRAFSWDLDAARSYNTREIICPIEGPPRELAICREMARRQASGESARGLLHDVLATDELPPVGGYG